MRGKKLYKSVDNKILFGVCGGVAEFFGIDPTIVRIIWATLSLMFGMGIVLYILGVFLIPSQPVD